MHNAPYSRLMVAYEYMATPWYLRFQKYLPKCQRWKP